ncbi:hypothetical protein B4O85_15100 [Pseudomonas azotoformans]|uniref:Uncharacterized protein n=1 Tax=Pseudomonas azotoformans TaxID=47878 RepID=A0A4Q0HVF4_PSEAZ|nr:hypothetical protein B4O85_15100 [Pseudomonas azotoformans]
MAMLTIKDFVNLMSLYVQLRLSLGLAICYYVKRVGLTVKHQRRLSLILSMSYFKHVALVKKIF